ncbi:unnamed protein product [Meganyctiphanes norvegica]|uniref:MBD domain-containing protein n=1 Tax=Meganyctiphanes norvegica TaxID=48144 RepID=A0AAV2PJ73_MEGNR
MNNIGSGEIDIDLFECSECDFKCSSKDDVIEHSVIHQCPRIVNENTSMEIEPETCTQYSPDRFGYGINAYNHVLKTDPISYEEISTNNIYHSNKDTPDINSYDINTYKSVVKTEPISYEEISKEEPFYDNNDIPDIKGNDIKTYKPVVKTELIPYEEISKDEPYQNNNETPDINSYDIDTYKTVVKTETMLYEEIYSDDPYHEHEIGNKKLKVEKTQIEHKFNPDYSPFQISEHANIYQDQNSNIYGNYGIEALQSGYENTHLCNKKGTLNTTNNGKVLGSVSYLSELSQNNLFLSNSSQGLTPWEMTSARTPRIEVEVDNTGLYIPPGWNRKLYIRTGPFTGNKVRYDCYYFTELGKIIRSKKDAHDYLNKNPSADVDIGKLTFPLGQKMRMPDNPRLEVDVDNTGIYIPESWQRKLIMSKNPKAKIKYRIIYICPEGKRFLCKSGIYLHIFRSDRIKDKHVDLEQMNFSVSQNLIENCHKSTKEKKLPIIDNTGVYIPEGWQRTLNVKGNKNSKINYISPEGDIYWDKSQVCGYIYNSDRIGYKDIEVEKMNFSARSPSCLTKKKQCNPIRVLDNTGIYIPEGWQRKLYMKKKTTYKNKKTYKKIYGISYVTPEGKILRSKKDACKYLSHADIVLGIDVDVDNLNFFIAGQPKTTKKWNTNIEKDKVFGLVFSYIFDVRTMCNKLYLCRLCSYLSSSKSDAYSHINEHIQKLYNELPPTVDLPNKYNYFVCTDCHGKIMRRKDVKVHMQTHSIKQISGTVIGVRCEYDDRKHVKKIVHCCEVCDFASMKYIDIYRHISVHNTDEIHAADNDKYNTHANEVDENPLYSLHTYRDSDDNDGINNRDVPASKIHYGRSYIKYRGRLREMEVDNTGKYIPKGWQRKVFGYKKGQRVGYYHVCYISPFGKTLRAADQVPEYIKWLKSQQVIEPLDVEKFDFSVLSHNLPKRIPLVITM